MKIVLFLLVCALCFGGSVRHSYCSDALLWIEKWEREDKEKRVKEEIKLEAQGKIPPGYHRYDPNKPDENKERKKLKRWWLSLPVKEKERITQHRENYLKQTHKRAYGY